MFVFFFFQAEDGIRDGRVTGVQTCALPIFAVAGLFAVVVQTTVAYAASISPPAERGRTLGVVRSEERRVGKEWRSRWSPLHQKQKYERLQERPRDNASQLEQTRCAYQSCHW